LAENRIDTTSKSVGAEGSPYALEAWHPLHPTTFHRAQWATFALSTAAVVIGILILIGWAIENPILAAGAPGFTPSQPETAVVLILVGLILFFLQSMRQFPKRAKAVSRVATIAGVLVILEALLVLLGFLGFNLGLDTLFQPLLIDRFLSERMAPNTAAGIFLLGAALLFHSRPRVAQVFAIAILPISFLALVGYAFNVETFTSIGQAANMAIPSAIGLALLAFGILLLNPHAGITSTILAETSGGYILRRLLPLALLTSPLLSYLQRAGEGAGFYSRNMGSALRIVVTTVVLLVFVWVVSRRLHETDIARQRNQLAVNQSLRRMQGVQEITEDAVNILSLDDLFEKTLVKIKRLLSADAAAILLTAEGAQDLVVRAATGLEEEVMQHTHIPYGTGLSGRVAAEERPLEFDDIRGQDVASSILRAKGLSGYLGVPLRAGGEVIGVLHVTTYKRRHFTSDDVFFLQVLGDRLAVAIERARLFDAEVAARERAELALQVRNEFIAVASHELKTPLTALVLQQQLLSQKLGSLSGEAILSLLPEYLARTEQQFERLTRLVDDLLNVARISHHQIQMHTECVDLKEVIDETVNAQSDAIKHLGSTVEIDIDPEIKGQWDRHHVQQIMSNLLSNAVKYGEGSPVKIAAHRKDNLAEVSVNDQGMGISKVDQDRIFDRFERAVDARNISGFGLGLFITRELIDLHGGEIEVDSDPGRGTTFKVTLPLVPPQAAPTQNAVSASR
jgi:signal transduction histidine kinase